MNKLFYIFISTILIFSACNKNTEQTPFDLFTKKVHIQCQKIEIEFEFIGKGGEMIFFEKPQQLIIHDWANTEYLLKRIYTKSLSGYVKSHLSRIYQILYPGYTKCATSLSILLMTPDFKVA